MTDSPILLVETYGHVERWTLNRPDALNAFNKPLLLAINAELDALPRREGVRAVVVCGAGGRALSAGADLKERKTMPPDEVPAFVNLIGSTFTRVADAEVPFIAAVDGFAFGGGMELALACDLRVFGAGAKVGLTETRLAIIPGAGGTQRLPRLVGIGRAKELIYTGRRIDAEEAYRIGLAEVLADAGQAVPRAHEVADEIAKSGPVAVKAAKAAIDGGYDRGVAEGLAWERACYDRTLPTQDRLEALAAFAEKRAPRFQGR
jgi:methylglutaconyl-CoA hydratase